MTTKEAEFVPAKDAQGVVRKNEQTHPRDEDDDVDDFDVEKGTATAKRGNDESKSNDVSDDANESEWDAMFASIASLSQHRNKSGDKSSSASSSASPLSSSEIETDGATTPTTSTATKTATTTATTTTTTGPRTTRATAEEKRWMDKQRKEYFKYLVKPETSNLTPEKIERLNSIHFNWKTEGKALDIKWKKRFLEYKELTNQNGGNIPSNLYMTHPGLYRWAATQRHHYKKLMKGVSSWMTPYRIKKLNRIGFEWTKQSATIEDLCVSHEYGKSQVAEAVAAAVMVTQSSNSQEEKEKEEAARAPPDRTTSFDSHQQPRTLNDLRRQLLLAGGGSEALKANTAGMSTNTMDPLANGPSGSMNPLDVIRLLSTNNPRCVEAAAGGGDAAAGEGGSQMIQELLLRDLLRGQLSNNQNQGTALEQALAADRILPPGLTSSGGLPAGLRDSLALAAAAKQISETRRIESERRHQLQKELLANSRITNQLRDAIAASLHSQQQQSQQQGPAVDNHNTLLQQLAISRGASSLFNLPTSTTNANATHSISSSNYENNHLLPSNNTSPLFLQLEQQQQAIQRDLTLRRLIVTANDIYVPNATATTSQAGLGHGSTGGTHALLQKDLPLRRSSSSSSSDDDNHHHHRTQSNHHQEHKKRARAGSSTSPMIPEAVLSRKTKKSKF